MALKPIKHIKVKFLGDWEWHKPRVFQGDEVSIPAVVVRKKRRAKK